MSTFSIKNSQILDLEEKLRKLRKSGMPFATKSALNDAAFFAMKKGKILVKNKMTLRNKWTVRSLQVEKASGLDIQKQESIYGTTEKYMETQEFGGTESKKGQQGVAIPTAFSAGQGMAARPRTRLPRRPNQIKNINLSNARKKGSSRKQRNFIAIRESAASGRKFLYLELARTKGIFKVTGGKRKPKIKMVYNLNKSSVRIPKNPWLKPSFDQAVTKLPFFYFRALKFQLERLRLTR